MRGLTDFRGGFSNSDYPARSERTECFVNDVQILKKNFKEL